jgi:hypothetical protein
MGFPLTIPIENPYGFSRTHDAPIAVKRCSVAALQQCVSDSFYRGTSVALQLKCLRGNPDSLCLCKKPGDNPA